MDKLKPYAKAVVGFLAPGILILCQPLLSGRLPTTSEYLIALGTAIATGLAVYAIPNQPADAA